MTGISTTNPLLRAFLINPWKRSLSEIKVSHQLQDWYQLLHCDCIDVCHVANYEGKSIDIFVDDQGLLHEPQAPLFYLRGRVHPLCGYGLVTASNRAGETVSLPESLSLRRFAQEQRLIFEIWEGRLDPRDVDPEHIL